MKKQSFSIVLILLFAFSSEMKADTIDFYHVFYNSSILKKYNQYDLSKNNTISIDLHSIKEDDSIKVMYWDDTPCIDCKCYLNVYTRETIKVDSTTIIGAGKLLSIRLFDMRQYCIQNKSNEFKFEYYESNSLNRKILFYIKLEH
jgi:hypothetical protein